MVVYVCGLINLFGAKEAALKGILPIEIRRHAARKRASYHKHGLSPTFYQGELRQIQSDIHLFVPIGYSHLDRLLD